jgi:hypothetical protein
VIHYFSKWITAVRLRLAIVLQRNPHVYPICRTIIVLWRASRRHARAFVDAMRTRIAGISTPAIAGGLVVLAGVALRQLGIEFERAWMRSYEGPPVDYGVAGERGPSGRRAARDRPSDRPGGPVGGRRRWVANHHPRARPASAANGVRPD